MAQYDSYNNQSGYGQSNRYDQPAGNSYGQQAGYGAQAPQGAYQQGGYAEGNNMEMGDMNGQQPPRGDPMAVLNEAGDISRGIDVIERNLSRLQQLQKQSLDDPDASQNTRTNRELDNLSAETMTLYRNFTDRIRKLKGMPGAGEPQNAPQVGRVERKLKDAIHQYQTVDADFRSRLRDQMARQYRIVRPDASEAEVKEACDDTSSTQVFSQALLNSDRRGQSQSALRAVQGRHEAIQKIERDVVELAQLFEDMNALVVAQEPIVAVINEHSENVKDDMVNANVQLDNAVVKARAARKKKWICCGICVLIILVIIVVVLAAGFATGAFKSHA